MKTTSHRVQERVIYHLRDALLIAEAVYDVAGNPKSLRVTEWNQAAEHMTGIKREAILGQDILAFFPHLASTPLFEECLRIAERGGSREVTAWHCPGAEPGLYVDIACLQVERGTLAIMFRDITQRQRAEEQLRESEERYRQLVELAPDAIYIRDQHGKIVFINAAGVKLFGAASPEELMGKSFEESIHPDYQEIAKERLRRVIERRGINPLLAEKFLRLDGTAINVEVTASAITYQNRPAVQVFVRDITERRQAEAELLRLNKALRRNLVQTAEALAAAVDAKDPYTHGHSRRVAQFAVAIGREMGLPPEALHDLRLAGILHDLGKIGIPAEVLSRPRQLTPEELALVQTHVAASCQIVEGVELPQTVKEAIAHHHEKYDGSGYPTRLSAENISLGGRVLALADAIEAITSDRPYRKARGLSALLRELGSCAGSHFDPTATAAAIQVLRSGRLSLAGELPHGGEEIAT